MRRREQYLASVFLSAALMAPLGAGAKAMPQDDRDHERHEQEEREHRVYDPYQRGYHNWDQREDDHYRRWLGDRHEDYRPYDRLSRRQQREYWKWRHRNGEHEEHEEHEHQ